jgi:hypothetical protein
VAGAEPVCPSCGFGLAEERLAGRGVAGALGRISRSFRPSARTVIAIGLLSAVSTAAALTLPAALTPASTPISGAEAEGLLALRYPQLRDAPHAVIACPRRRIEAGGESRCWILPRVGHQRAVVVRLSPRGDSVEIDD